MWKRYGITFLGYRKMKTKNKYDGLGGGETTEDVFKCRDCGTKYPDSFCSTDDVGVCRWCSGEEK